ncbi:MAG: LPP20 family lipoprotein [Selenomonadaceae bacterium]|nr:LPP20 family lipoprotein [Selenomonadaceae bacterium]MBR3721955.1 LPP20 family lipoprotein [Selenomonadaceae bacterium]
MKKKFLLFSLCLAVVLMLSSSAFAANGADWENEKIIATGMGVAPANVRNQEQARMMARRAAMVDAYRQLAEFAQGINIDAETTVKNMVAVNDTVNTKVSAVIKGARIVNERSLAGGGYEVTMEVPLYGVKNSLAAAVITPPKVRESFPSPIPDVTPSVPMGKVAADAPPGRAIGGYTGLIVDCRGLDLSPVMSPVIKNENGAPIYGYRNLDIDRVIAEGMASYTYDIDSAPRAGNNPLIVRAIRLDNHNANPVVSLADANRILIENGATHFLDSIKVVFVR